MRDSNRSSAAGATNPARESWASHEDALDLRLWLRMLTCSTLVENRIRSLMRTGFDTTLPRFDLMAQLANAPRGMKMSELSRCMMVTNGNITGITDQLERDGLVERVVVTAGEPLVAPGDTVQAGMTLISGALTPGTQAYEERVQAGLPPVVRAAGSVLGRAWYRGYGEARPEDAAADDPAGASPAALPRAAVERARRQARASLPPEARVIDEEVVVVDDRGVEPGVVRAAVTITVLQERGRFSPLAAEEP